MAGDDVTDDMFPHHAYLPKPKPVTTMFPWRIPTLHLSPPPNQPKHMHAHSRKALETCAHAEIRTISCCVVMSIFE